MLPLGASGPLLKRSVDGADSVTQPDLDLTTRVFAGAAKYRRHSQAVHDSSLEWWPQQVDNSPDAPPDRSVGANSTVPYPAGSSLQPGTVCWHWGCAVVRASAHPFACPARILLCRTA